MPFYLKEYMQPFILYRLESYSGECSGKVQEGLQICLNFSNLVDETDALEWSQVAH